MIRIIALIAFLLFVCALLTACGDDRGLPPGVEAVEEDAPPVRPAPTPAELE